MTDSREIIAKNPDTALEILEELSNAAKPVRISLSLNPNLPASLIEELANDFDEEVRASMAKSSIISTELLTKLSKDKSSDVKEAVAENPNTAISVLEKLFYNPNLKEALAKNISLPDKILKEIIKENAYGANFAKKTLKQKLDNTSKQVSLSKYTTTDNNIENFKKLEEAVTSKKIKIFKDTIKEILIESDISVDEYKRLAIVATELTATPILKHIFKLIEPEKELLSDCYLIAIRNNKIKVVEYLLELGANINIIGKDGLTALITSVENNKPKTIDFLLEANINIDFADTNGNTALHHAIEMKKSKIVEALINKNADLNIENNNKLVPLALAWNLDVTPAVIDLLIDANTTNMQGEAGQKVMKEAFKIYKGRKKDQRIKMKELFLKNRTSSMTKDDFIKKHGKIKEIDTYISALKAPNDDFIMKGLSTNIGYFPRDTNFLDMEHNWEAIDYAIGFTNKLAEILKDTHSLHSEGQSNYEAFFIPEVMWVDLANFDAKASREALDEAHDAYNKWPTSFGFYKNIFSEDIKDDLEDLTVTEEEYKAFTKASKLMEDELTSLYSLQMYPSFIEFPWFFLGMDKYRNLVGVVTSAVWT